MINNRDEARQNNRKNSRYVNGLRITREIRDGYVSKGRMKGMNKACVEITYDGRSEMFDWHAGDAHIFNGAFLIDVDEVVGSLFGELDILLMGAEEASRELGYSKKETSALLRDIEFNSEKLNRLFGDDFESICRLYTQEIGE